MPGVTRLGGDEGPVGEGLIVRVGPAALRTQQTDPSKSWGTTHWHLAQENVSFIRGCAGVHPLGVVVVFGQYFFEL